MPAAPTIRTRLMRLQWLALLLAGAIGAGVSFGLTWQQLNRWRDHTLEQVAQSVVRHGLEIEGDDDAELPDTGQFTSQIWTQDGQLHYSSAPDGGPARQPPGWHTVDWAQQEWKVFTLQEEGLTIQISQPALTRSQVMWRVVPGLLAVLLAVVAVLYALLHWAATASLRPLQALREGLSRTDPQAPDTGLAAQTWPAELVPLVQALDDLFDHLHQARTAQQHLVARAAHEFRTPLAALRIHAQLLARAPAPETRERHSAHLVQAVDRMSRLVDQLLRLAEFEAMEPPASERLSPVADGLRPALALWQALADARDVRVEVCIPPAAHTWAHAPALHAMLDNLMHNAIRHSPAHATVTLELQQDEREAVWTVVDHGPGLTPEQKQALSGSFVHAPGTSADGSGLGLAIARRVARLHGGTLTLLDTPGTGLTVQVVLPVRPPASES
jgi:signal transduction histidine kinase